VATNTALYDKMTVNMDINAGTVIEGKETVKQQHIFDEMIRVASGKLTKAEIIGHNDFGIWRIGPTM
jgi:altronate dehydratase large subunit